MTTSQPKPQSSERDYFTDPSVLLDPYSYFEELRPRGPVCRMETHDYLLVTGFQECVEVLRNPKDFSSINSLASSAFPVPFKPEGSDITEQIDAHRDQYVGGNMVVTYDDKHHTDVRSLISRMFMPSRLRDNETFMREYAQKMVADVVAKGGCELVGEIATPYVTMVIADLLGVPPEDRALFEAEIAKGQAPGSIENPDSPTDMSSVHFIAGFMGRYLHERAANPGDDLLSELVTASYPDGGKPDMEELVILSTFMFAAGQDTSAKLLGNAMRYIVDVPDLQRQLREDRKLIPWMLEEVLRLEGSSKATHRLARRDTTIGDMKVPAGTQVTVALAAANRDPRRWGEDANEFKLKRPGIREHIAFGRGSHTCAGAPLARAEVTAILNAFFDQTSEIFISEEKHGKPGARTYQFEPSFIIRGLDNLYLELKV